LHPDEVRAQANPAPVAAAPATPAGSRHMHLSLKDLRIKTPIRLAGTRGEIGIPFGMRQNDVVTAAELTLHMAWSPALLG
ncbi:cellulose biosynthesis cyclic di-GMP-binding regulatory protein BcsB, partial [Streptomyces galilaeus]|uniref:cellulose biosynthesis cyclic di-GMP-binding regulatory protein BcsB n=1 Tax=Streptomyces galilaeus TaxID=33899 RepID=UPI0038F6A704